MPAMLRDSEKGSRHQCPKQNFAAMSRKELSGWYVQNVGYDLGEEDPEMSTNEYRTICAELDESYRNECHE